MNKTTLHITLITLLTFIGGLHPVAVDAASVLTVSPSSPGGIRSACMRASAGDTIVVRSGFYREGSIVIDRPLVLTAPSGAVIDAGDTAEILIVRSHDVRINGFTLKNTGTSYIHERAAVRLERATNCVIENNTIINANYGIYSGKSSQVTIRNNTIHGTARTESGSGNGIHCWYCQDYRIEKNTIISHRDGIYLEFTTGTRVQGNESKDNMRYGLHFMFSHHNGYYYNNFHHNGSGVAVMYTNTIEMIGNIFADNLGDASYGLLLKDITNGVIRNNVFRANTTGIYTESGGSLQIRQNDFIGNGWALRLMASSTNNTIDSNNFLSNSFDVATNSYGTPCTFHGNYWDTYTGYDIDKDRVGDVPFRPVRLFSTIIEQNAPAMLLLHSFFVSLLDIAESIFPTVTPAGMQDPAPSMHHLNTRL